MGDLIKVLIQVGQWLLDNLAQTLVGILVGFLVSQIVTWIAMVSGRRRRDQTIVDFFGLEKVKNIPGKVTA